MGRQKVQAVLDWPVPRSVRAMRAFLGLAGYYHRFIRYYGAIAAPLTKLLRKEAFRWSDDDEMAFRALQRALTAAPVLQLPDFNREFIIECDASGSGFGALLHQGTGLVAFYSKQIVSRHTKLTTGARSPPLASQPLGHFSLKFLLDQKLSTIPQHQWPSKLLDFDFRVEYKPGSTNIVADALLHHDTVHGVVQPL
jgi:hypothetical protein